MIADLGINFISQGVISFELLSHQIRSIAIDQPPKFRLLLTSNSLLVAQNFVDVLIICVRVCLVGRTALALQRQLFRML